MTQSHLIAQAQEWMAQSDVDGWLLYDYRGMNPFLPLVVGPLSMVTRPVLLFVPAEGEAALLAHHVDTGRFSDFDGRIVGYTGRDSLIALLGELLNGSGGWLWSTRQWPRCPASRGWTRARWRW